MAIEPPEDARIVEFTMIVLGSLQTVHLISGLSFLLPAIEPQTAVTVFTPN